MTTVSRGGGLGLLLFKLTQPARPRAARINRLVLRMALVLIEWGGAASFRHRCGITFPWKISSAWRAIRMEN
jgi:hypothetical protein